MSSYVFEYSSDNPSDAKLIGRAGPFESRNGGSDANLLVAMLRCDNGQRHFSIVRGMSGRALYDAAHDVPQIDGSQKPPALISAVRDGEIWVNGKSLNAFLESKATHFNFAKLAAVAPVCCSSHYGKHLAASAMALVLSAAGLKVDDVGGESGRPSAPKEKVLNLDRLSDGVRSAFDGNVVTDSLVLETSTAVVLQDSPSVFYYAVLDFYEDGSTVVRNFGNATEAQVRSIRQGVSFWNASFFLVLGNFKDPIKELDDTFRAAFHYPSMTGKLLSEMTLDSNSERGEECCIVGGGDRKTTVFYDPNYWITKLYEMLLDANRKIKVVKHSLELDQVNQLLLNGLFSLVSSTERLPSGSLTTRWGAKDRLVKDSALALVQCVAGCLAAREAKRLIAQRNARLNAAPSFAESGTPA